MEYQRGMDICDKKIRNGLFWCQTFVIIDLYFYKQKGRFVGVWDLSDWNKVGYKMLLVFLVFLFNVI
jgi:hypothetical protein